MNTTNRPTGLPQWWCEIIDRRAHDNHAEDTPPPRPKTSASSDGVKRYRESVLPDDLAHSRKLMN